MKTFITYLYIWLSSVAMYWPKILLLFSNSGCLLMRSMQIVLRKIRGSIGRHYEKWTLVSVTSIGRMWSLQLIWGILLIEKTAT